MPINPISDIRDLASRTEDTATLKRLVGYACDLAAGYEDLLDCTLDRDLNLGRLERRCSEAVAREEESAEGPYVAQCPHCLRRFDPALMTTLPDGTEVCDQCHEDHYAERSDGKIVRKE